MARLAAEGHPVAAWSPAWPGDLHAGRTETSLMLAIAPGRVRLDRAEAGDRRPIGTLLPLLRQQGVRPSVPTGSSATRPGPRPRRADRLLAGAVDELVGTARADG